MPGFVLAFDVGQLIGLAVLVISIISWLVNLIKGEGNNAPAGKRAAPQKDLRSEIEVFLEELNKPPVRQETPPPRPAPKRAPPQPQQQKPKQPQKKRAEPISKRTVSSEPRPGSSNLGAGVRQHVAEHLAAGQVTANAQQNIGHRIDASVAHDLGTSSTSQHLTTSHTVHPLITFLSQPGGMRQAMLVHELLQKPRALRKDR